MFYDEKNPNHIKSLNRFSFPYNGEDSFIYLRLLEPFRPFIHDIFLGLPDMPDFFSGYLKKSDYYNQCRRFLSRVKDDTSLKTVVTINGNYTLLSKDKKLEIVDKTCDNVEKYNIYGAVVSDFFIAEEIHKRLPKLVLNTSCNVPQYKLSQLNHWRKYCGINTINPTRDSSFDFNLLKQFKSAGFKIKLLVNEMCHYRCPNICSFCSISCGTNDFLCTNAKYNESPFQSCLILPRWLDKYDDIVDIYKITGRYRDTEHIFKTLEYYINREDFKMYLKVPIPTQIFPDKLLYCNHLNCDSCGECKRAMNDYLKKNIYNFS